MFETIQRWLRRSSSQEPLRLVVEGTIVASGTHSPRTHLGPEQAPPEAWLGLELSRASLSDGTERSVSQVVPAEFSGPVELLERWSEGDRVRITTSSATGRQIHEICALGEASPSPHA